MDQFSPWDWGAHFVFVCFGVMVAEGCLISMWSVWGGGRAPLRLARSFAAALTLGTLWWFGVLSVAQPWRERVGMDPVIVILCLPAMIVACPLPYWTARVAFRWRVTKEPNARGTGDVTIWGLMIATALIGAALTTLRYAWELQDVAGPEMLPFMGIFASIIFAANLLGGLPLLAMLLRVRRLSRGIVASSVHVTVCLGIVLGVVDYFGASHIGRDFNFYLGMVTVCICLAATIATPLISLRRAGYRLAWGRGRRRQDPENRAAPDKLSETPAGDSPFEIRNGDR
jgi:hypothetical protein